MEVLSLKGTFNITIHVHTQMNTILKHFNLYGKKILLQVVYVRFYSRLSETNNEREKWYEITACVCVHLLTTLVQVIKEVIEEKKYELSGSCCCSCCVCACVMYIHV